MKNKIKSIFKEKLTPELQEKVDFLSKIKILKDLNVQQLVKISSICYERKYTENEIVFFRNDVSKAIYIVLEGKVELSLDVENTNDELFSCSTYDSFGINALIESRNRDFNARISSENAILYVLPQTELFELFQNDTTLKATILYNLGEIYDTMFQKIFKTYRTNLGFFEMKNAF